MSTTMFQPANAIATKGELAKLTNGTKPAEGKPEQGKGAPGKPEAKKPEAKKPEQGKGAPGKPEAKKPEQSKKGATPATKRPMGAEHKASLIAGRARAATVRRYLELLEGSKYLDSGVHHLAEARAYRWEFRRAIPLQVVTLARSPS